MDRIRVVSLNVRGMREVVKRKRIFKYLKKYDADICLLQETHCKDKNEEHLWGNEWGNKVIFSNGTTQSKGVTILFNKKSANTVRCIERDMEGRFLSCIIKIGEYTYRIINMYGPNEDNTELISNIIESVKKEDEVIYMVWGGDFNEVRDAELDRNSKMIYHRKVKQKLDEFLQKEEFVDIWHCKNPDKKSFSWMKKHKRTSWSRIDYFLTSPSLTPRCENADIVASAISDHSMLILDIDTGETKRGPGIWKFNDQFLNDKGFCEELDKLLKSTIRSYDYMSPSDKWEMIKFEISNFSREYVKATAKQRKQERFNNYVLLSKLQDKLASNDNNRIQHVVANKIDSVKAEIEACEIHEAKKAAFRSRVNWQQCGEVSSKYYFNLEK